MDHAETEGFPEQWFRELAGHLPEPLFRTMLRQHGLRKITVEQWNGRKAEDSEAKDLLVHLGAERDRTAYVLWPSSLG